MVFFGVGALSNRFIGTNTHLFIEKTAPTLLPDLTYTTEDGSSKKIKDSLGTRMTIVHLWATWCAPCVAELPTLDRFAKAEEANGIQVFALSEDGKNISRVKDFYRNHRIMTLVPVIDTGGAALAALKAKGMPYTVLVDAAGTIVARAQGAVDWEDAKVQAVLQELMQPR